LTRILYSLIWLLVLPLAGLRLLWRGRAEKGYREAMNERLGFFPNVPQQPTIWIHAVSVGETRAAQPLIAALKQAVPGTRILLTQTTATGRAAARTLYGDEVTLAWLPWDLPWAQRAFLARWQPAFGILMETELWPNLLAECKRAGIPVVLVNARMSERSSRGYARVARLTRAMLESLHVIAAQTADDAARLRNLGARRVEICGNLKFDVAVPHALRELGARWRAELGERRVVLLASTREGEEELLLGALNGALPADVLIALVPRHPQRFDEVATQVLQRGLSMVRRSQGGLPGPDTRVWLGDSMGEMFAWYALADIAVMGGSWLPLGGQNLIEACAMACPVVVGPHTFNFTQATEDAIAAGAAIRAAEADTMAIRVTGLIADDEQRRAMSAAALAFAVRYGGATGCCMTLLRPLLARIMTARTPPLSAP
jgi:3-deoxy-D-manno-octulosonic-acid transferase